MNYQARSGAGLLATSNRDPKEPHLLRTNLLMKACTDITARVGSPHTDMRILQHPEGPIRVPLWN